MADENNPQAAPATLPIPSDTLDTLDELDQIVDTSVPIERPANDLGIDEDDDVQIPDDGVLCEFLTGAAGTGKTFEIQRRIRENPKYGVLAATTGIAGVNLGAITINSLLKYFDTESLRDSYLRGFLTHQLADISKQARKLIIDEISMMDKDQLQIIWNANAEMDNPLGIVLTGDFCQLPPVKADWAFKADCWKHFEKNITRLTEVKRQSDPTFLEAVNAVRSGDGQRAVLYLKKAGVEFATANIINFDGTTILPKNDAVDRYNREALAKVQGEVVYVKSVRWGKERTEWKNVPEVLALKIGAYVMILSNDAPAFSFANGDCGHIVEWDRDHQQFAVKLVRNQQTVWIPAITRRYEQKEKPDNAPADAQDFTDSGTPFNQRSIYRDRTRKRWVLGEVKYFPLRLAYAATVHKTQGLSLDRVQIDVRQQFFGAPAMAYVAISRARSPKGLRIVGTPDVFAARVKVHPEVLPWL
jgi:ATP-dependent DNA helicase PIF1